MLIVNTNITIYVHYTNLFSYVQLLFLFSNYSSLSRDTLITSHEGSDDYALH